MANMFQQRDEFIAEQREAHLSVQVTYAYLEGGTSIAAATVGRSVFEVMSDETVPQRTQSRDFVINTGQLTREPRRGDLIKETIGDDVQIFELAGIGGEQAWIWADASHTAYRCHTKHVGTETPAVPE